MTHPYQSLPDFQFHRRAMENAAPAYFDPVAAVKFNIETGAPIATLGSCFAQNLSKYLLTSGANLLRTEASDDDAGGLFSANVGNVYTAAQALQLHQFAFGKLRPSDDMWANSAGKFVDPLRPGPTHKGFGTAAEAIKARTDHYVAVRSMFEKANVLVFTLGLTETWRRKSDNAILPLAPGVVAGSYKPAEYDFVNFSYDDVCAHLDTLIGALRETNATIKIILTVSPIPLAATFVSRHVAVSSMASKSILRAAADAISAKYAFVDYFPSFEIFFTPGIGGKYFQDDARHAAASGVAHAMRVFDRHYLKTGAAKDSNIPIQQAAFDTRQGRKDTWCDEDALS